MIIPRSIYLALSVLLLTACQQEDSNIVSGYVEAETLLIAPSISGRLVTLDVNRGQSVNAGASLFQLETTSLQAAVDQATAGVNAATAQAADMETGKRPSEIAAIEASLQSAKASLKAAESEYQRQRKVTAQGYLPAATLDVIKAQRDTALAKVRELEAQRVTARLSGREQARVAAQAGVKSSEAVLTQAQWQLEQAHVTAAVTALVQETYFRPGEWVAAGKPVVSLLPPENRKVRFFVPETKLGSLQTGQLLSASCDGCSAAFPLTITYISPEAEYTPPVIYSNESRSKLVVMLEAVPAAEDALKLKVGQPVDVVLP